jgi:capsule polysaccharide modification protein KpsS
MKKTIWLGILAFSLFLMGCGDVLTVLTVNEDGEKVYYTYISLGDHTVYDSTVTLKNWQDVEHLKFLNEDDSWADNLLFKNVKNKENIVVLANAKAAIEISFFDGGYKYALYMPTDGLSKAFN